MGTRLEKLFQFTFFTCFDFVLFNSQTLQCAINMIFHLLTHQQHHAAIV